MRLKRRPTTGVLKSDSVLGAGADANVGVDAKVDAEVEDEGIVDTPKTGVGMSSSTLLSGELYLGKAMGS